MPTSFDKITNDRIAKILAASEGLNKRIYQKYRLQILRQYKLSLTDIQSLIAEIFAKYGDKVSLGDMNKFNRLKNLEAQIQEQISKLNRKNHSLTAQGIKESYSTNYYFTAFANEKAMGLKLGFGLLNPKKIEASILNPLDRITWISRETEHGKKLLRTIKEEITQGLIQGKGYVKTAREIKKSVDKSASQVLRVVQTESHRAQVQGEIAAYEKVKNSLPGDLNIKKVWLATLDDKTRPSHRELDGIAADDKELFHINGFSALGPGLFGIPEEDINCRCEVISEIEGYSLEKRKDNESKEIINYKNYNQWYEGRIKK